MTGNCLVNRNVSSSLLDGVSSFPQISEIVLTLTSIYLTPIIEGLKLEFGIVRHMSTR